MTLDRRIPAPSTGSASSGEGEFADAVQVELAGLWARALTPLGAIGGTANAITASGSPPFLALAGNEFAVLVPAADTTGPATLNVDALGVRDVRDRAAAALTAGALKAGVPYLLWNDGTRWRVVTRLSNEITAQPGPDLIARDEKAAGTGAANSTAGSWIKRAIGGNTLVRNVIAGASMTSDEITLPAGTFSLRWSAPAYGSNGHQSRLYNVTGAAALAVGESMFTASTDSTVTRSNGTAVVVLAAPTAIRLEHRVVIAQTNGFGLAANVGATEVYAWLEATRIA